MENKQHSRAKVLTYKVQPSVIDNFSSNVTTEKVLLLKCSTHQNVVVAIPPRRDEHLNSWHVPSSGFGEVRYMSSYWEWVEDVLARCKETLEYIKTYDDIIASMFTYDHNENRPSTNTVSTFVEELSISLWDLRTIRGLPVHGSFYDEVIPSAKELTHVDDQGKSFLARSYSLFSTFYQLTKGAINEFVLPNKKVDCIRASVFKVASLMVHGEIFSLAVPVLASIYCGLRDISTSSNMGSCNTLLPIHYVYGWICEYFETYYRISGEKMAKHFDLVDAHKLFQQVNVHNLHNLAMIQGKEADFDDSGKFRPFGYCQDVPSALINHHYDGSLLALVQLWDSCVHLGSSLKIIIPMRPSNKGSLMIRPKKDDASLPTKGEQFQEKLPHSLKSKVTENIPPQSAKVVSKSKTLKGKATHVDTGVKSPLKTPKEANITTNEVIDVTLKRKKPSSSSDKSVENSLGIAPSRSNTFKTSISLHEIGICNSAASSSNDNSVSQELHWKHLKKKPKELNNQQCEFTELDSISIDTAIFEDGDAGSTMPLSELAHQVKSHLEYFSKLAFFSHWILILFLGDIPSDVDVFEDCITSPNSLNMARSSHLPLVEVKSQAANEIQVTKLTVHFFVKAGVALIHKGLREVNIINLSPLEVLLEEFFKKHRDYDVARLSTSQKITRDSHQELLSPTQQCLDTVNEERISMDKQLEEFQKKVSENQETTTKHEDEIHAIEEIIPLSEPELKELAKLKEDAKTSCHQILSHKLFP
ncbi:hypothetical protein H5410_056366 [Solanum commersonii]|uniref:Aminotransferase-like plant mobile domain-containing protein n=1 Tax=Solanum commersonii TaxID=4109 RepID=A0A9J5WMI0_SOLCO|nr:hypothetical protein H5410_056366 [Solanum commersonii]